MVEQKGKVIASSKIRYFEKLSILTPFQWEYLNVVLRFHGPGKKRTRIENILAGKEVMK